MATTLRQPREVSMYQFTKVGKSEVFMATAQADLGTSMRMLNNSGLKPLTLREVIVLTSIHPELMKEVGGRRFYLSGKGTERSGFYTFNEAGELSEGAGDRNKTIHVNGGPLGLLLYAHDLAAIHENRTFSLNAHCGPYLVADIVVGVKTDYKLPIHKSTAKQEIISRELIAAFRDVVELLDSSRALNPKIADISKKVLKAIERID